MSSAPHDRLTPQPVAPRSFLAGILAFLWSATAPAQAHDLFAQYIQHQVQLTTTTQHIDVTLTLTFFEAWSQTERAHMDRDGNGLLQRGEITSYLKELEQTLNGAVRLSVDGQPVPLSPLYEPEVDLLDNRRVGPGQHRLTLCFFAPLPDRMKSGSTLLLEERLWPAAHSLGVWRAERGSKHQVATLELEDPAFPPMAEGQWRRFQARCVESPRPMPSPDPSPSAAHRQPSLSH